MLFAGYYAIGAAVTYLRPVRKDMSKLSIRIDNVLDDPEIPGAMDPELMVCVEEIEKCTGEDRKCIFPSERRPACRSVAVDFGRSHYYFTNGGMSQIELVHMFCYRNHGEVTDEERERFFHDRIGIAIDPVLCDDVTPTRGFIIARVKYELLKEFWNDNGFEDTARELAFMGMYYTTQHPLRYIKYKIIDALHEAYENDQIVFKFSFVRIDFSIEEGEPILQVHYLNYYPKKGNWQVMGRLPEGNPYKIEAIFRLNLHTPETGGEVSITTKGTYTNKEKDMKKCYGLFNASKKKVIRYKDTMPTW